MVHSVPALIFQSVVEQMSESVKIANGITVEQCKALTIALLCVILLLIPVAGEVLGSIDGLAEIGFIVTAVRMQIIFFSMYIL